MDHVYCNPVGLGMLHGLAARFVGDLVGEDNHGVGIAYLVQKIVFVAADALQRTAMFFGDADVVLLQPVHAANQCYAHTASVLFGGST